MLISGTDGITVENRKGKSLSNEFFVRLLDFYSKQTHGDDKMSLIWLVVSHANHGELVNALKNRNIEELKTLLSSLYTSKAIYGIDSSEPRLTHLNIDKLPELAGTYKDTTMQMIVTLAKCTGIVPIENPEQVFVSSIDIIDIIQKIEEALQCRLSHPGFGNISGLVVENRFIPHKLVSAAILMSSLTRRVANIHTLLEIGAGIGWVGYVASAMLKAQYHTIDLPIVSVLHAYMLASATSEECVWLDGENHQDGQVFFVHGLNHGELNVPMDVAVNENSFPELTPQCQKEMIAMLTKLLREDALFFSVNHESPVTEQTRVYDAFRGSKLFRLISRNPWWIRKGYVEEVYQKL